MKIDPKLTNPAAAETAPRKSPPRPAAETAQSAHQSAEVAAFKVNISTSAEQLLKSAPTEEQIRLDKVAAIRDQLASGSYNISGKDVATKILNALKN